MNIQTNLRVERANRAVQLDLIWNDIGANTPVYHADRDDRWCGGHIQLPAGDSLQSHHDLRCHNDWIYSCPGPRRMGLAPANDDVETVGARHRTTAAVLNCPNVSRKYVQAKDCFGSGVF